MSLDFFSSGPCNHHWHSVVVLWNNCHIVVTEISLSRPSPLGSRSLCATRGAGYELLRLTPQIPSEGARETHDVEADTVCQASRNALPDVLPGAAAP